MVIHGANVEPMSSIKPKISKTFQKEGHWIVKPNRTVILVCSCGNKYIKTRDGQTLCVRCMSVVKKV